MISIRHAAFGESADHSVSEADIVGRNKLLGFLMAGMLLAETAILAHLKTVGIVLLVLHGIVIALLALAACQRNLDTLIRCQTGHLPYV